MVRLTGGNLPVNNDIYGCQIGTSISGVAMKNSSSLLSRTLNLANGSKAGEDINISYNQTCKLAVGLTKP